MPPVDEMRDALELRGIAPSKIPEGMRSQGGGSSRRSGGSSQRGGSSISELEDIRQKLAEIGSLSDTSTLKSKSDGDGSGVNPRARFYSMFQREMEEHDQDYERKCDEDLNTTLIFSGLFSAITSAFIINIQSEFSPDYEQMNNVLLKMLLIAATGPVPADFLDSIPEWTGPDAVIVQVQCVLYATLSATLLASFLAMLGKQWLSRYKQNETRGSAADRSRLRERKLTGIETWRFQFVMETLPLILQFALVLLGFALSRYLWEVNRSVSAVIIGFACFGFLFYAIITTISVFSVDCPYQTPFSLVVRTLINFFAPYAPSVRISFRRTQTSHPVARLNRGGKGLGAGTDFSIATPPATQPPSLFVQENDREGDRLDARCIDRLLGISTDTDVITAIMDFIPEITWHSGIKTVPLARIYNILIDCFDFSGPHPAVIPKWRDVAYLSAKAFVHIELQRRCLTQYEEHKKWSWETIRTNHRPLLSPDLALDSDLATALLMVDLSFGHGNEFTWEESNISQSHRAWMSHVFIYRALQEDHLSNAILGFIENSTSLESLNETVLTDCYFIIGLAIGIQFNINDITVKDKSRMRRSLIEDVFKRLGAIFSSKYPSKETALALPILRLATSFSGVRVATHSLELFKKVLASPHLVEEQWDAARAALYGAFQRDYLPVQIGDPKEIFKFLDYHICLEGKMESHKPDIKSALHGLWTLVDRTSWYEPLPFESFNNFRWTSPSFVRGIRSLMHPHMVDNLRGDAMGLIAIMSDKWFNSPQPIMEPEEMTEFLEHTAQLMDKVVHVKKNKKTSVIALFGILRSPEWRKHIPERFWSTLAYCPLIKEVASAKECLQNAAELLKFTKELPHKEGLKWWHWTLWFHYDRLDTMVRDEVKKLAEETAEGDGLADLNLYLRLFQEEIRRVREKVDRLSDADQMDVRGRRLKTRLVTVEGNYNQLTRIVGGR